MSDSPILAVHILGGTVGLVSGTFAMAFRKGSPRHVLAGKVFVAAMLTMAAGAAFLGISRHQPANLIAGILTFYLVGTGWLTARHRDGQTAPLEWIAPLIPLTVGLLTWASGIEKLRLPGPPRDGVPAGMHFFLGSVALLAAAGDVRMIVRRGVLGARRIRRHLWRMCFGLFIASGSFFLGPSNRPRRMLSPIGIAQHLPAVFFSTGLYLVLTILPLALLIFWLVRVRFTNDYKRPTAAVAASHPVR